PTPATPVPPGGPRLAGAVEALARRDYVTAFRRSEAARKEGVPLPALLEFQVELFRQTYYLDKEMAALRQWAAASPHDPRPWRKLFYIYLDMGWRREATNASERAMKLAPDDAD